MPEDFVFIGPSLTLAQARPLLPDATFLPPVEHGDLLRIDPAPGDRVLIIDGLFMLKAPVRHREILALLARGVTVAGSSSMGALRAAELWRYGMRGAGEVFELFRSGMVTGDDEVAVVHGMAEDEHRLLSEPLVNLRISLAAAVRAGAVTDAAADELLELCRALPFRARTVRALRRVATGDLAPVAEQYADWAASHPIDAKADDARLLLRMAAANDPRLCPPDDGDTPIENLDTYLLEAWATRHHGTVPSGYFVSDARVVGALMALYPDFATLHRRHVLAEFAGTGPEVPACEVEQSALNKLAGKGLLHPDAIAASGWLTGTEQTFPLAEQALLMAVRTFGTMLARPMSQRALPHPLREPSLHAEVRQFIDSALRACDQLPHPDPLRPHLRLHFRDEVVDRMLCTIWGCDAERLPQAAADRGFDEMDVLRTTVEPFMVWLKMWGPPTFRVSDLAKVGTI